VPPEKSPRLARRRLGAGGVYLCIRHDPQAPAPTSAAPAATGAPPASKPEPSKNVVSCYMHLDRYSVATGQRVKAGDTIAMVGRTGVRRSPPHLHFEVRIDNRFRDPWRYFADSIMPPNATMTHVWNQRAQKARLRAMARAQRAARARAKVLTTR
jgi:murein DD-endopeptidase MepM/ murein hydrolase activator NlpD